MDAMTNLVTAGVVQGVCKCGVAKCSAYPSLSRVPQDSLQSNPAWTMAFHINLRMNTPLFARINASLKFNHPLPRMAVRCLSEASAQDPQSNDANSSNTSSTSSGSSGSFFDSSSSSYSSPYTSTGRRRPYNVESKLRLQEYRRQAAQQQRQMELEEERRTFQLDKSKMYPKGHPSTVQGVVKEIIDIGYILTLPNGREGLLSAMHLGCSSDLQLLSRLFSVGDEIPVRVIRVPNPAGKDRCYIRDINSLAMP